ncbi:MAG: hypothetical protein AMK71_02980 [Nitrospira bacterium SG8_35_4]|nr:MAG: hypothetical protein AMK71_02980 [Nitrospira bacterium SG8_35_4]
MKVPFIFLKRESRQEWEVYQRAFEVTARTGMYILGENVSKLERALASYLGAAYVVTVNSGTDALFLSMRALDIATGDEVITVGNSFIATVGAVTAAGATPVLVDVLDDQLIDPDRIEEKITEKTKAIIPVHLTGRPADMQRINAIAKKHGLFVIDDAAQSFGAVYRGKRYFDAHAACYSFHPLKNYHCLGDGGAIATNNETLNRKLLQLRNHGINGRFSGCFGYNSRLDEIQASLLLSVMPSLDEKLRERRRKAVHYIDALGDLVHVPSWDEAVMEPAFQTFVVQTDQRDELAAFLHAQDVETKVHYPIPCHQQDAWSLQDGVSLPVTEMQSGKILSLPLSHLMTEQEQEYVIDSVRRFFV